MGLCSCRKMRFRMQDCQGYFTLIAGDGNVRILEVKTGQIKMKSGVGVQGKGMN